MTSLNSDEARRRFAAARVARLATITPDGAPHVVPVTFAVENQTIYLSVDTKPKTSTALVRLRNVRAVSNVSLIVDEYSENWSDLWWVRADGKAQLTEAGDGLGVAIQLLQRKYPQYADSGSVSLSGPAIVIAVTRWSGWSYE